MERQSVLPVDTENETAYYCLNMEIAFICVTRHKTKKKKGSSVDSKKCIYLVRKMGKLVGSGYVSFGYSTEHSQ
jgi:hypothetical protein